MATPKRALARKYQQRGKAALQGEKPVRTTLMIKEEVDTAVEICAAVERRQKSEVVNDALTAYLRKRGHL
jgi:hypothetical protein